MNLYEEALLALGTYTELSEKETDELFNIFIETFPITSWGKIDWDSVDEKVCINSYKELSINLEALKLMDEEVYILWGEGSLLAVKSKLKNIILAIDDLTAVSFDTWMFHPSKNIIIEFYHENEITLGL